MAGITDPSDLRTHDIPEKHEIEDAINSHPNLSNVQALLEEYPEICRGVARDWLQHHDIYRPTRSRAGHSSPMGQKLLDADPSEIGGDA